MPELILYTNPMSRGRIARRMVEELDVPYESVILDYATTMKAPDYLALNRMGKVPTLRHGEAVISEVAAICTYLADAFPAAGLAPEVQSPERGAYLRWMFFASGPLEAAVAGRALGVSIAPDQEGWVGYGNYQRVMDTLEALFADGRAHVLGDRFTAVDVYLGAQIGWGLQFGTIEERPGFREYAQRADDRAAAKRATQKDDALVAQEGAAGT